MHTLAAGAAMVVAAGWWIALVELWPAGSRPYIGGSTNNSVLELVFGYNGIGRLTGADNNGSVGGNGTGGFSSGQTGLFRLFGPEMGTQISWLLPAALVGLAALAWLTARRPRTDPLRASAIVWGGWLLVTGVVLSFASGIIHPYYTVALAPAIAALVGSAAVELWRARSTEAARWTLAALVAAARVVDVRPARPRVVAPGAALDRAARRSGRGADDLLPRLARAVVVAPLVALTLLVAPTAYSLQTASTAHTGALPSAGPATRRRFGRPGGAGGGPGGGAGGRVAPRRARHRQRLAAPPAARGGTGPRRHRHRRTAARRRLGGGGGCGGMGGLGRRDDRQQRADQGPRGRRVRYTWAAATVSDNYAASLELATGRR